MIYANKKLIFFINVFFVPLIKFFNMNKYILIALVIVILYFVFFKKDDAQTGTAAPQPMFKGTKTPLSLVRPTRQTSN